MSRLAAIAAAVLVLASASLAAYFAVPKTALSKAPTDVDHVALYQNGLAAITLVRPFQAVGGDQVLTLSLPTTTIFDSLTIEGAGVTVREMRSSLAADPALRPGDSLVVHLGDGTRIEGTFQSQDGDTLLLARAGGTAVVHLAHARAIEVAGRTVDPSGPGTIAVQVLVRAEAGSRTVRVGYLAHGVGWEPNHILDAESGAMTFFATLTGMQEWSNVTLELVAGRPNVVYTPGRQGAPPAYSGMGGVAADYESGFEAPQPLGALRRYKYATPVDLEEGQTVRLPVVSGKAEMMRHYYRADGYAGSSEWRATPETYQLRNTLGDTLPAGPVRIFVEGAWQGADQLPSLGRREETNLTVAFSDDVKVRTVAVDEQRGNPQTGAQGRRYVVVTTTWQLEARNLGTQPVDLRASFATGEGGTTRLVDAQPPPDHRSVGNLAWDDSLPAGATLSYRITIQHEESVFP